MKKVKPPLPLFDTLEHTKGIQKFNNLPYSFCANDYRCAYDFLRQYDGNQATFNSYRREAERFLHWCWLVKQKSILAVHRADIEDYIKFCTKPPKTWISLKKVPRFKNQDGQRVANTAWRPFVVTLSKTVFRNTKTITEDDYQLSQKTIKEIFVSIGSFYTYLMTENIMEVNPVAQIRQKSKFLRKHQGNRKIPRLSDKQWQAVIQAAVTMADKDPIQHERTLFIITALYLMYLRISELVASSRWIPLMKHFYKDSHSNWWFATVGKGNKERHITVSDGMLESLKRWRKHLGLSPALPTPNDNCPLLPKTKGTGGISSTRWINYIVQGCFDQAILQLRQQGLEEEADALAQATVHWLRHTGISDDINKHGRPIIHVRDDAGHASIATTDRYNDIMLRERHASAKNKQIITIDVEKP